ncbi:serine protease [Lentzea sp. NBRC 105346]|uniref:S1 family peptidase n=1 Tax=Lentzea sp. NBRC 105346 TaxID=3032205 RepID=UPI0024A0AD29|nr:serine protease [Lentzea sp. NBRC 105346]GLZ29974.1 serine protease [Lentzea sp. NBRC 105346]
MRLLTGTLLAAAVLFTVNGTAVADDVSAQIIGGTTASTKDYPFAVFLVRPGVKTNFCGGSVIAPNKILTAAHCADDDEGNPTPPADINVVAGRDDERTNAGVLAKVTKVALHPKWDGFANDFAVLTLDRKLSFQAIPLATTKDSGLHAVGKRLTVLGWGRTVNDNPDSPLLMKTTVPVQPDRPCRDYYGKDTGGVDLYDAKVMICAGDNTGKHDSCRGDSGGPFIAGGKLVGVVSFGPEKCATPNVPAVYAKVSAARAWIRTQ